MSISVLNGDCREVLATLPEKSVRCCVTSPPYFGLRDYGVDGQIGIEPTPDAFVSELVSVFREVRRVLADDGTVWLNLGDSYAGSGRGGNPKAGTKQGTNKGSQTIGVLYGREQDEAERERQRIKAGNAALYSSGFKPKDLIGIPWRVAFALQADGWWLRQDIIWHKPAPMPESVLDRCTRSHEYIFLLSKSARYYFDAKAIAEPLTRPDEGNRATPAVFGGRNKFKAAQAQSRLHSGNEYTGTADGTRNKRSVWTIAPSPFPEAHFASFPPELPELCIKAGSAHGDTVLDPFGGAGTTGLVADRLGRNAVLIELNPAYASMARNRVTADAPLLAEVTA